METLTATKYTVEETTNYSQFKFMKGNRKVDQMNLKRITESMRTNPLFAPILVNEKMEIIDGQHRFLAQKELNLPIHYIVVQGYSIDEVHILNTNSSNWKKLDYLDGYVDMGLRPYIQFKEFKQQFPEFGIKSLLAMVMYKDKINGRSQQYFQKGELQIPDIAHSRVIADRVLDFKPFFDRFAGPSFVGAVIHLVKNKYYDHDKMLARLSRRPNQITPQTNSTNYLSQLEEIYNYNSRQKVNLRY